MKKAFVILWRIVAIIVLFAGFPYVVFYSDFEWAPLIWWGACIVLNLPMIFGKFIYNDNYYTASHMVVGAIFAFLFAPILLLIKIISSFVKGSGSKSSGKSDSRTIDTRPFASALESAVKSAVYSASKPSGYYVQFQSIKNYSPLIGFGKIKLTGTLVYSTQYTPDLNSLKNDLESCLNEANQNILNGALKAVETVREKYRGYDDEWQVEVKFGGEIK